jgi:RNA polymerase sigma factor (sigma-70 family)
MIERCSDLERNIYSAAERAIQRCARELLTVELVAMQVRKEWEELSQRNEEPSQKLLNRLALRYCSRILYRACCSSQTEIRNFAFANLRRYMEQTLRQSKYAPSLTTSAAEDVLQQTLADLQEAFIENPPGGPNDPSAFLKWAQTVLIRHAYASVEKMRHEMTVSLDEQPEAYIEQVVDQKNLDPEEGVVSRELQQVLKNAILSLSNPRYQKVLIGIYLVDLEERELAAFMGVQVQDIYLWRHRALNALRSKREVIEALRPWLR